MDEPWSSPGSAQEAALSGGAGIAEMTSGAALTLVVVTQALAEMAACCRKSLLSFIAALEAQIVPLFRRSWFKR